MAAFLAVVAAASAAASVVAERRREQRDFERALLANEEEGFKLRRTARAINTCTNCSAPQRLKLCDYCKRSA